MLHDAAAVLGGNRGSHARISDADREDRYAALLREFRVLEGLASQVAAVGYENDRVVVIRRGIERVERRADR